VKEDQKRKFHRIERCYGTFRRSFTPPEDADSTKVTAEFHESEVRLRLVVPRERQFVADQLRVS
jgi:HSP20 family protein